MLWTQWQNEAHFVYIDINKFVLVLCKLADTITNHSLCTHASRSWSTIHNSYPNLHYTLSAPLFARFYCVTIGRYETSASNQHIGVEFEINRCFVADTHRSGSMNDLMCWLWWAQLICARWELFASVLRLNNNPARQITGCRLTGQNESSFNLKHMQWILNFEYIDDIMQ